MRGYGTANDFLQKVMKYFEENNIEYNKIDTADEDNVLRLMTLGGKDQVPFLYDEKTDDRLYESDDIIDYVKNKEM